MLKFDVKIVYSFVYRPLLCWRGGVDHASILPVWRHCEHSFTHGVVWWVTSLIYCSIKSMKMAESTVFLIHSPNNQPCLILLTYTIHILSNFCWTYHAISVYLWPFYVPTQGKNILLLKFTKTSATDENKNKT